MVKLQGDFHFSFDTSTKRSEQPQGDFFARIALQREPCKVDIISIMVMLENILYDLLFFLGGGARSSSVLIVEDCVVTSINLACSRVVSLTFTPYLFCYKKNNYKQKDFRPFHV